MDVAHKDVRTDFLCSLILRGLVDFNRLPAQLDHVQNLNRIVCVLLGLELNKPITLVLIRHLVTGYMDIDDGSTLQEQLPDKVFIDFCV